MHTALFHGPLARGICRFMVSAGAGLCLAGCSPAGEKESPPATPAELSTAQQALEGFTGKTAVDSGMRAKKQLQAIDAQRREQMSDLKE